MAKNKKGVEDSRDETLRHLVELMDDALRLKNDILTQQRLENQSRRGNVLQWWRRQVSLLVMHTPVTRRPAMVTVTSWPLLVTLLCRGMPGSWKSRHRLLRCWLVVRQALCPGRKTLAALARWTPAPVTVWRLRRLLKATYWDVHLRVAWGGEGALQTWPPPKEGTLYLVGDGRVKPQRGPQNPLAQKGRKSEQQPWVFGMRFVLLIATWDVYRLPVAFRLIRVKTPPAYQTANTLFREMGRQVVPPGWAQRVIVEGDAAYGSRENMQLVLKRDAADPARRWGVVFALARTGTPVEGQALHDVVTPMPRKYYQRTRVSRLPGAQGSKTFWRYSKRLGLRHIGDVTVVLSNRGRNLGPKPTKILVTNLAEWTSRQVVGAYPRRWPVEQINRELKTDLGLGEHQVSTEEGRIEKSFGIAVLAYLLLIRACHQEMLPGTSWSIAQLQQALRLRVITNQVEHKVKTRLTKVCKAA